MGFGVIGSFYGIQGAACVSRLTTITAHSCFTQALGFVSFSIAIAGWRLPTVSTVFCSLRSLRDRSRVVPRSDRACVFTKRFMRSENAGFTKSLRVIGEHVSHPLDGWRTR